MGKTAAEWKADERKRMRARGFILKQFWVHPSDWVRVRTYLLQVNHRRTLEPPAPTTQPRPSEPTGTHRTSYQNHKGNTARVSVRKHRE